MTYAWPQWFDHVQYVVVASNGHVRKISRHTLTRDDNDARHVINGSTQLFMINPSQLISTY